MGIIVEEEPLIQQYWHRGITGINFGQQHQEYTNFLRSTKIRGSTIQAPGGSNWDITTTGISWDFQ